VLIFLSINKCILYLFSKYKSSDYEIILRYYDNWFESVKIFFKAIAFS